MARGVFDIAGSMDGPSRRKFIELVRESDPETGRLLALELSDTLSAPTDLERAPARARDMADTAEFVP